MPAFSVTVLYPNEPDTKFDMSYYLSTHMPLVQKRWGPIGLNHWRITKFSDKDAKFSVEAKLLFASKEKFDEAGKTHGEEVFGDIPNFCNQQPVVLVGEVVGES